MRFLQVLFLAILCLVHMPLAVYAQSYAPAQGPTYWTGAASPQLGNEIVPSGTAPVTVNAGTGAIGLTAPLANLTATPTNGQIPIGNGTAYTPATLTGGNNVSVTNGAGSVTLQTRTAGALNAAGSPYTFTATHANWYTVDTSSGNVVVNLPTVASAPYKHFIFKKTAAANTVTINCGGSDAFADTGGASTTLTGNNEWVEIQAGAGVTWQILACGPAARTNSTNSFTASQLPNAVNSYDLGSTSKWWRDLFLGTSGSNYLKVTATPTGNRTFTAVDADSNSVRPTTATAKQWITHTDSTGVQNKAQPAITDISGEARFCIRASLSATDPNPQTVGTSTSVYLHPFNGTTFSCLESGVWVPKKFDTIITVALGTVTADLPYDIFVYDADADGLIEAGEYDLVAWTNATTRATALSFQSNIPTKTGATSRTFVCSVLPDSTTTVKDDITYRGVSNYWNRLPFAFKAVDSTDNWTLSSGATRPFNNSTTLGVGKNVVMSCHSDIFVDMMAIAIAAHDTTTEQSAVGIGIDATNTNSSNIFGAGQVIFNTGTMSMLCPLSAKYSGVLSARSHALYPLERSNAGTVTFYGDASSPNVAAQSGLHGTIWM